MPAGVLGGELLANDVEGPPAWGEAPDFGTGDQASRYDHTHGLPAEPAAAVPADTVTGPPAVGAASAAGASAELSRADHIHGLPSFGAVAGPPTAGAAAADGAAATLARSDHVHGLPAFGAVAGPPAFGAAAANGAAATLARSDHVHGLPAEPAGVAIWTPRATYYYTVPVPPNTSGATQTVGTLKAIPLWLPTGTIVRIAVVVNANVASSLVRLGLYTDSAGKPDVLLAGSSTISAAVAVNTVLEFTVSIAGNRALWLACVGQTAAPNLFILPEGRLLGAGHTAATSGTVTLGYSRTGVTGALPDPWGATATSGVVDVPAIFVRY